MNPPLTVRTLSDGGQSPAEIANAVASFLDGAEHSLDLAQYDFNLGPETAGIVGAAIRRASGRGVRVRLVYNVDHRKPIPVPPPCSPDEALIRSLPLEPLPVAGVPDLMHHKYVIRDGTSVWTGSTNWSDDSWSRQENVIAVVESPEVAADYRRDFEQLLTAGSVAETGAVEPTWHGAVRAWFTPAHGEDLSHRIAQAIALAERRIRVCSPVLTAPPVLGALAQAVSSHRVDTAGCLDETQTREVASQWRDGPSAWKLPLLTRVLTADFTARPSTPFGDGTTHDFMHAKLTVADDNVFLGSFNLSRSGERNAENILEIQDEKIADQLTTYADEIRAKYDHIDL